MHDRSAWRPSEETRGVVGMRCKPMEQMAIQPLETEEIRGEGTGEGSEQRHHRTVTRPLITHLTGV